MRCIMDMDFFSPSYDDRQGFSSAREAFLSEAEKVHNGSSVGGSFRAVEDVFGSNVIDMDVWGMESDHYHHHHHDRRPKMEKTSPNKAHIVPTKGNTGGVFSSMNRSSVDTVAMPPFDEKGIDAFSNSRQQVLRTRPSERSKNQKRGNRTSGGDNKKKISSSSEDRQRSRSKSVEDDVGIPVVGEFILEVKTIDDPFAHADLKLKDPQAKPADRFRKEKIDALMSSIKNEQGRRPRRRHHLLPPSATGKVIEAPRDDDDRESWMELKGGDLERDKPTPRKSSLSKKSQGSCRGSPITTQSPRSTRIIHLERVPTSRTKEKRHHSNSPSYLSERVKERAMSDKNSSKDRRSSVHDSLSQFLESKNLLMADKGDDDGKAVPSPNKRRGSMANRSLASASGVTREHTSKARPSRRVSSKGGSPMFGEKSSGDGGSSRGSTRSDVTTRTPRHSHRPSSGHHQAASLEKYMMKHRPPQLMGKDFEDAAEYRSTSSAPAVATARHNDMAGLARSCRKLKLAF